MNIFWNPDYLNQKYQRNDYNWLKDNVRLNHYGYRDKEFTLEQDPQTLRILSLGSSYTFGWYINNPEDTYPKQLETKLQNKFPGNGIEVINAARPGFNLQERINRLKIDGLMLYPDIVTLSINVFDLNDKSFKPRHINNEFVKSLKVYQFLYGRFQNEEISRKRYEELSKSFYPNSEQLNKLEKNLEEVKKITDESNIELIVLILPELDPQNPNGEYRFEKLHQQIKQLAQKHSIRTVDFWEKFASSSQKDRLILNPTDPHPSTLANQIAAEYIIEKVDFEQLLKTQRSVEAVTKAQVTEDDPLPKIQSILRLEPAGWVYFDHKFGGTMNFFLPENKDQEIFYMEDILKTAAAFTNEGWPGAKIEHRILPKKEGFNIPLTLYGYQVVGLSGVTGFWVEKGALRSQDFDINSLNITKDSDKIYFRVKNPQKFLMYKATVDIKINQIDIDSNKVSAVSTTKILTGEIQSGQQSIVLKAAEKIGSLPKLSYSKKPRGYIWLDNVLVSASLTLNQQELTIQLDNPVRKTATIEVPVSQKALPATALPLIVYR